MEPQAKAKGAELSKLRTGERAKSLTQRRKGLAKKYVPFVLMFLKNTLSARRVAA